MSNFEIDILPSLLNSDAEVGLTTCNTDPGSILFCWHMNLMEKEEVDDDDDDDDGDMCPNPKKWLISAF